MLHLFFWGKINEQQVVFATILNKDLSFSLVSFPIKFLSNYSAHKILLIAGGEKRWIHTFPQGISIKWMQQPLLGFQLSLPIPFSILISVCHLHIPHTLNTQVKTFAYMKDIFLCVLKIDLTLSLLHCCNIVIWLYWPISGKKKEIAIYWK